MFHESPQSVKETECYSFVSITSDEKNPNSHDDSLGFFDQYLHCSSVSSSDVTNRQTNLSVSRCPFSPILVSRIKIMIQTETCQKNFEDSVLKVFVVSS